jgi:hypothetical protein
MSEPHILHLLRFAQASALAAAMLLLAIPTFAQDVPRRIAIAVEGQAEFDVIYRRAVSNATGAFLGGLIGAGIQTGIESNEDADKRAAIHPYVAEHAWRDVFIGTMTEALAEKGLEPVWIEASASPRPGTADMYLVLYPAQFGFRMVDTTSRMLSAFVEFEAAYSRQPITGKNKPVTEPFYITDRSPVSYDQLLSDTAGINSRIELVLEMAARRLTNKVYYNNK